MGPIAGSVHTAVHYYTKHSIIYTSVMSLFSLVCCVHLQQCKLCMSARASLVWEAFMYFNSKVEAVIHQILVILFSIITKFLMGK